jgi:ribosomal protein S18 acetylase RimI-like enzyme
MSASPALPPPWTMAHRDARRLALVMREVASESAPVGEGCMACDGPDSWANYAVGLGVTRPPTNAELDALVAFYERRGFPAALQVTPYQDPALLAGLALRGFVVDEVETVLVRPLTDLPPLDAPAGVTFRRINPRDEVDVEAWVQAQADGFSEGRRSEGADRISRVVARHGRSRKYLVELEGRVVGAGGLEEYEGSSVLIAGCVHPDFRRRGLQRALIRFRLHEAAAVSTYALVGSLAGGPTERNARREGFATAYAQLGFVRPKRLRVRAR